jgi:hypothetical protein
MVLSSAPLLLSPSLPLSHLLQVINLWGYALNYENTFLLSTYYALTLVAINFLATIGDIIYLCMPHLSFPLTLPHSLSLFA